MALHKSIPRERVPNKCSFVLLFHVRCLLVDGVVAAQYRVVDMRHMCCARGKDICLFYRQHRYMQLRRARAEREWRLPASSRLLFRLRTLFVVYAGVAISSHGPLAQGFVPSGAELVIMSGVLLSQSAKSVFSRRIKTNALLTLLNIF
jgi:hypothetical protein